jgi:hypothetical protein
MTSAKAMMSALGGKSAALPGVAARLENIDRNILSSIGALRLGKLFEELYMQYTMEIEREVHLKHSDRFGIIRKPSMSGPQEVNSEEVLFF